MSRVPTSRRQDGGARRSSRSGSARLFLFLATLLGLATLAPAAQAGTPGNITRADLCRAWTASTTHSDIDLSGGASVKYSTLGRVGGNCLASNAEVRLTGTQVIMDGGAAPTGTAASRILAAVTQAATSTPDLKPGDELFYGAYLKTFNASLKLGYFDISGELDLQWTGGTVSRFLFKGRLYGIDRFNMTLYSPSGGTVLPNIGGSPVSYTGTLQNAGKKYTLNLTGNAPSITVGAGEKQLSVTNGTIALNLSNATDGTQRLHADVTGKIGIGTGATADGKVSLDFDKDGLTALSGAGSLDVDIPAHDPYPAGNVTGNATFTYAKDPADLEVDFTGTVTLGDAIVANAAGTLDDQSVVFKGDATYTSDQLTAKGAVDGLAYYGTALDGRTIANKAGQQVPATKGDFLLKAASADVTTKGAVIHGDAQVGLTGAQQWVTAGGSVDLSFSVPNLPDTSIKGKASVDWVVGTSPSVDFDGSIASGSVAVANAKGSIDGKKVVLSGDVTLDNGDLVVKGAVDGTVYYADGGDETLENHAGTAVAAKQGDFLLKTVSGQVDAKGLSVKGTASVGRIGTDRWATASGALDATYNGTNVKGSADVDWVFGQTPTVNFSGSVASNGVQLASASGTVDGQKIALKANGTLTANGITAKGAIDGVVFYGSDLTGATTADASGKTVAATKGDFVVKSASADLSAQGLAVSGTLSLGKAGSSVWANGGGSVDATYTGTNLKGSATVAWVLGQAPTVTFKGTVTSGTTTVANASGTLDGAKIALKGDVTYSTDGLNVKGAVDGVVFYGADLSGEKVTNRAGQQVTPAKGDWVLHSATGGVTVKGLDLTGGTTISSVGGDVWGAADGTIDLTVGGTHIAGKASATFVKAGTPSVSFDGTVTSGDVTIAGKGTIDGKKIALSGTGALTNPNLTLKGGLDGVVFYGSDLTGETITNRAGQSVQPAKGDFLVKSASASVAVKGLAVSGAATIGSVGTDRWVKGGGAVDATYNGTNLKGSADIDWLIGQTPSVSFTGSVAQGGTTIASASGTLDGKKITVKGTAQLTYNGITAKGAADATVYYGSDLSGEQVTNRVGQQVAARQGDMVLKGASLEVTAKGLTVTGQFAWTKLADDMFATGHGTVDAVYGATALKGAADLTWYNAEQPTVTFGGTLTSGSTTVANASGTLDGTKLSVKGDATYATDQLTVKGAVEGTVWYGYDLSSETVTNRAGDKVPATKGDFVLKSATGGVTLKGLQLNGGLTLSSVGGDQWGTANGSIDATYNGTHLVGKAAATFAKGSTPAVTFDGTVTAGDVTLTGSGAIDGQKIAFKGSAAASVSGVAVKGAVEGVVFYGSDLSGQTITNKAGASVAASRGDFLVKSASADITAKGLAVSGAVTIGSVGSQKWVTGGGSLDATYNGANVKGTANVDWLLGQTPAVTFSGALAYGGVQVAQATGTVDGAKIAVKGSAQLTANGITAKGTVDAVLFYGSDLSGEKVTNKAGAQVQATKGDVIIKSATADVSAQGWTVTGSLALSKVGSDVWATGTGAVDLTYGPTNLKGSATIAWAQGGTPSVAFTGTLTSGTTTVANAAGTLDGAKIALKGDATYTTDQLTVKGAADGTVYYGSDLSGEKVTNRAGAQVTPTKGDYVLKSASGAVTIKGLALTGGLTLSSVGGDQWGTANGSIDATYNGTHIVGSANATFAKGTAPSVSFDGTVTSGDTVITGKGTVDGQKIALSGTAKLTNPQLGLSGSVDGIVFYGSDLTGQAITNKAGQAVQATKGDWLIKSASGTVNAQGFTLTGAVTAGSVGSQKWVTGGGSVDLTWNGTNVKGSANVDWLVGQTPAVTFSGSVTQGGTTIASASGTIDGKKIALKGTAQISYNGIAAQGSVDGVVYYGGDLSGETVKNRAGQSVAATKGDLVINGATLNVTAKDFAFTGKLALSKVGSDLWLSAGGAVDLTWNGTNVKGSANVDWAQGGTPSVSFAGTLTNGSTVVANAAGVIDGKKIQLKGSATIQYNGSTISGAVDGVVFYGNDLTGETIADRSGNKVQPLKGDYNLASASGSIVAKGLNLSGAISLGNVRGDQWASGSGSVDLTFAQPGMPTTRIQGSASLAADGNVAFQGTITYGDQVTGGVQGTADGKKITFTGQLSSPTLSGAATGTVWYGKDLSGETVKNQAGQTVQATAGDFVINVTQASLQLKQLTATAKASASKVGQTWWIHADANIKVGDAPIVFTGDIDSSGNMLLKGSGTVNLDGYHVDFAGSALVRDNRLVLDGTVALVTDLFKVQLTGTIEKPNMDVNQYTFTGKASLKFGTFQVADATVRLTWGEGLTTSFGIKTCFLFVCPNATYKLYFQGGKIARAEMQAPIAWVPQFLVIGQAAMPGVSISTTITGII